MPSLTRVMSIWRYKRVARRRVINLGDGPILYSPGCPHPQSLAQRAREEAGQRGQEHGPLALLKCLVYASVNA
jgi:hypothetical protein